MGIVITVMLAFASVYALIGTMLGERSADIAAALRGADRGQPASVAAASRWLSRA